MTAEDAQALAVIFAKLRCCDALALECSWVWPDIPWRDLIDGELAKERV